MPAPDQFISPDQWSGIKNTVAALNAAEVDKDVDLPEWFYELRDHLTTLLVCTTTPVEPFAVTEHFAYLLDMFIAGAACQEEVAEGSQLVVEWATQTLISCAAMGIMPRKDSARAIWLVVHAMDEENK